MVSKFQGFHSPNYTQVPDELFDELLPDLTGAELKVLLYIIRRTFGFKKDSDNISLNQLLHGIISKEGVVLDRGTGLSKKTLLDTIKSLVEKNLILTERRRSVERGDEPTSYRLHILDSRTRKDTETPRGIESTPGGVEKSIPGGSDKNYSSQETVKQETDLQLRNSKANSPAGTASQPFTAQPPAPTNYTGIPVPQDPRAGESTPTRTGSLRTIGEVLARHKSPVAQPLPTANPVSPHTLEPTPSILAAVAEIATQFGDTTHLRSNTTQAVHIWQSSGRSEASFVSSLYEARSITRQQRKVRHPMPYFWTTVRDLVGLKEQHEPASG